MTTPQTAQDLFAQSKMLWLEKARETARELLRSREHVTIEQVLQFCPRPGYIKPNVVGGVFRHPDFKTVGYTLCKKPSSHKRLIRLWSVT